MNKQKVAAILFSALGAGLILLAAMVWARMELSRRIRSEQESLYLESEWLPEPTIIPPTSTLPPTPTEIPTPTPTPQPQPPTRLVIPSINVNSTISEISLIADGDPLDPDYNWPELGAGVAHDATSLNPGEAGNIILLGHNNTSGEVFRHLSDLEVGDQITVYALDQEHFYVVEEVDIVRAAGASEQDQQTHAFYLGPRSTETLTLVSCWPYATYTHRIYIVAKPIGRTGD